MTIPITDLPYFPFLAIWEDHEILHFIEHGLRIDNPRSQFQHVLLHEVQLLVFLGLRLFPRC